MVQSEGACADKVRPTLDIRGLDIWPVQEVYPHKGVLAFYNELTQRADCMVEPPDSYSFRRKYLGGLPQTIVKTALEVHGISAEHSSIEEILDEVKRIESAQKALNLYTKQSAQTGRGSGATARLAEPQLGYSQF